MSVKQISVFLENKPGELNSLTRVLADHRIDMRAMSLSETNEFGIARIIVDRPLDTATVLKDAGYELSAIKDFASLKTIAEDIHARADELGFDAFASAGLDGSSSWRFSGHLATLPLHYEGVNAETATLTGEYMDLFKNVWDLYINNSSADVNSLTTMTGDQSKAEFTEGKAVFYQNGTWEYAGLIEAGMTDDQLAMIPI